MCGLVGYLGHGLVDPRAALEGAAATLAHRGPDDAGFWEDRAAGIALAHRRLAVQDLSPAGHQPMTSHDGRWVVVLNGEIYNHADLRRRLEDEAGAAAPAIGWRGHSDTETLLACFGAWGIAATVEKLLGMFAFACWDRAGRRLHLGRDRLGEKPLYVGRVGKGLAFASELKALRALPGFDNPIDRRAVAGLMSFTAVPGTASIYERIGKLAPGCLLEIAPDDVAAGKLPPARPYWRIADAARRGLAAPARFASDAAAADALEAALTDAVRAQMISDVPLGAFLSGGIDSSTIVALMQKVSSGPVQTFSIGFHEQAYNEAEHAKAVARHLGTEHHELYVDDAAARRVIPLLPTLYCEPFADLSQIPTFLVAQMARAQVTVCLSGDAGDELFGGYARYFTALRLWRRIGPIPAALRGTLAAAVRAVGAPAWNRLLAPLAAGLPARWRNGLPGNRLQRGAELLDARSFTDFYVRRLTALWQPGLVLGDADGGVPPLVQAPDGLSPLGRMMLQDACAYLPDAILVKVDRAAMAVSLETRVPMLDHRVVELAWTLPESYKVRNGTGKWLLRQVLARHVPDALVDRPKMGFGVPLDTWLRGPLRDWAEHLLDERRLREAGFVDPAPVRRHWAEHLSGREDRQYSLWPVLMFEAWRDGGG